MRFFRRSLALPALLLSVVFSSPCEDPLSQTRYETAASVMGCTFGVAAYGPDRKALAEAAEAALAEARRIDSWLSNYRPDSELSRLNESATATPAAVSEELFDLLEQAARYSRASEGAFDMTAGPLVRAWGFYDGGGRLPEALELAAAREKTGYQGLELDSPRRTVRFARPGMELDPGAIGKGYAVDRMVEVLRKAGVTAALVNACQSSVYGLGAPPEEPRGWRLEIERPQQSGGGFEQIFLKNESLSTSGSQEKFFEAGGRVYSHILDPRTGQPAQGILAVSVVAPKTLDSDVWSTAIFVNGLEWAGRRAPGALRIYGCPAGGECRWVGRP